MKRTRIYVSEKFCTMVNEFIKNYEKEYGILLTTAQATELIYKKIEDRGGLTI